MADLPQRESGILRRRFGLDGAVSQKRWVRSRRTSASRPNASASCRTPRCRRIKRPSKLRQLQAFVDLALGAAQASALSNSARLCRRASFGRRRPAADDRTPGVGRIESGGCDASSAPCAVRSGRRLRRRRHCRSPRSRQSGRRCDHRRETALARPCAPTVPGPCGCSRRRTSRFSMARARSSVRQCCARGLGPLARHDQDSRRRCGSRSGPARESAGRSRSARPMRPRSVSSSAWLVAARWCWPGARCSGRTGGSCGSVPSSSPRL